MAEDNYWSNIARSYLGQGLAMGWGDELEAKFRSMTDDDVTYEQALAKIDKDYSKFAKENAGAALTGEIVGGFLPTIGALLATPFTGGASGAGALANVARVGGKILPKFIKGNPLGRGMATGLTTGALAGAGSADEGERLVGAVTGGSLGLGLGAALPLSGRAFKGGLEYIKNRLAKDGKVVDDIVVEKIYKAVANRGGTPEDVMRQFELDESMGVPAFMGNYSTPTSNLTNVVATQGILDESGELIETGLQKIKDDTRGRLAKKVEETFGKKNYYEEENTLINNLRGNAKESYNKAYSFGQVNDDVINELIEDSDVLKAAYKRAKAIADIERSTLKARGEEIFPPLTDIDAGELPDVRTLDYMKRGLDDIIRTGYDGKSALGGAEAAAVKELKNAFVERVDEIVPDYKAARAQYKGDLETVEALQEGLKNFKNIPPEKLAQKLGDMSESEIEAYSIGASRNLLDMITKPDTDQNFARKLIGSTDMKNRLQILFPAMGNEGYELYKNALLRESQLFQRTSKILGGSKTASMQAGKEGVQETDSSNFMKGVSAGVQTLVSSGTLLERVANAIARGGMSKEVQASLAKKLISNDPKEVAATVEALKNYASKKAPKQKMLDTREMTNIYGSAQVLPSTEKGASAPENVTEEVSVEEETSQQPTEFQLKYPNLGKSISPETTETVTEEVSTEGEEGLTEEEIQFKRQFPKLFKIRQR